MSLPEPLAASIAAAPDDPAPYLVAADWLMGQGDPQGELIALSWGLEHEQSPAQFIAKKRRREELVRQHGEAWLGGSAPRDPVWRWGFVSHARLEAEQLDTFLASRAGRFVRELEVRGPLDGLADALRRAAPPVLRGLAVVGGPLAPSLDLASVTTAVRLERLAVVQVDADFTGVSARELQELLVRDVQHPTLAPFLATLEAPVLERLELLIDAPLGRKVAVVARAPKLRDLHLEDDLADELAAWAARAPVVRQLDTLTLCGPMTDRGLDALLIEFARLSRVRVELEGGHFSAALRRLAHRQLPGIVFSRTRGPWAPW